MTYVAKGTLEFDIKVGSLVLAFFTSNVVCITKNYTFCITKVLLTVLN